MIHNCEWTDRGYGYEDVADNDCDEVVTAACEQDKKIWKKALMFIYGHSSHETKKRIKVTSRRIGRFLGVGVYWGLGGDGRNHESFEINQKSSLQPLRSMRACFRG